MKVNPVVNKTYPFTLEELRTLSRGCRVDIMEIVRDHVQNNGV